MENPLKQLTVRERSGLAVGACGLAAMALIGWVYRVSKPAPLGLETLGTSAARAAGDDLRLKTQPVTTPETTPTPPPAAPKDVVVYVTGAVQAPGIYTLPSGARIYQAIHKAGGFRAKARKEALNLAERLQDSDQLYVPTVAEAAPEPEPQGEKAPAGRVLGKPTADKKGEGGAKKPGAAAKFKKPGDGTVKLNTASAAELQRLPGVGPALAERILTFRQEHTKFETVEQLGDVKGIGAKKLESLRPFLTLN